MKKIVFVLVASSAFIISCSPKTTSATNTTTSVSTSIETKNEIAPLATAKEAEKTVDLVSVGKTVFETRCGRCHGLKDPANYTEQRWKEVLQIMVPKARLNDDEAKQVTSYVTANARK